MFQVSRVAEDLLKLALAIAVAEEATRGAKAEAPAEQQKPGEMKIIRFTNVEPGTVISEEGSGRLVELIAVSDTDSYELTVTVDGRTVSSGLFSWYKSISQYSDWIDAFEDNGSFVLRLTDIPFSSSLSIDLRFAPPSSNMKFREVMAKIEKH